MKVVRALIFAGVLFAVLTAWKQNLDSTQLCPGGMIYIRAGSVNVGATATEAEYTKKVCDLTVGNCYNSWFDVETPRRAVMVSDFCIDKYEYPNQQGKYPATAIRYADAESACKRIGKRLCDDHEWEKACMSGPVENTWSYGYQFRDSMCNDNSTGILPSGYRRDCRTLNGVYDMNGNVSEWVNSATHRDEGGAVVSYRTLRGGSYRDRPVFTRCKSINLQTPGNVGADYGFRCCSGMGLARERKSQ